MKGILMKKSSDGVWCKRYCETDGVFLTIFKKSNLDKIIEIISLPQTAYIKLVDHQETDDYGVSFNITMPNQKLICFKAQTLKEASDWVKCLQSMRTMPTPTSLPTTPIDFDSFVEDKENRHDNSLHFSSSASKKKVTFALTNNEHIEPDRALSPLDTIMLVERDRIFLEKQQNMNASNKCIGGRSLQSREKNSDLAYMFHFRRDKQMILTDILHLYPASPASMTYSPSPSPSNHVPYTGILKKESASNSPRIEITSNTRVTVETSAVGRRFTVNIKYCVLSVLFLAALLVGIFLLPNYNLYEWFSISNRSYGMRLGGKKIKISPAYDFTPGSSSAHVNGSRDTKANHQSNAHKTYEKQEDNEIEEEDEELETVEENIDLDDLKNTSGKHESNIVNHPKSKEHKRVFDDDYIIEVKYRDRPFSSVIRPIVHPEMFVSMLKDALRIATFPIRAIGKFIRLIFRKMDSVLEALL